MILAAVFAVAIAAELKPNYPAPTAAYPKETTNVSRLFTNEIPQNYFIIIQESNH